jgi:uncharacterized protein (DUF983 family)
MKGRWYCWHCGAERSVEYPDAGPAMLAIVGFTIYGFALGAMVVGLIWWLS